MAALTPHARRVILTLATLYAAVVIPIQLHKGGDFKPGPHRDSIVLEDWIEAIRTSEAAPLIHPKPDGGYSVIQWRK